MGIDDQWEVPPAGRNGQILTISAALPVMLRLDTQQAARFLSF